MMYSLYVVEKLNTLAASEADTEAASMSAY